MSSQTSCGLSVKNIYLRNRYIYFLLVIVLLLCHIANFLSAFSDSLGVILILLVLYLITLIFSFIEMISALWSVNLVLVRQLSSSSSCVSWCHPKRWCFLSRRIYQGWRLTRFSAIGVGLVWYSKITNSSLTRQHTKTSSIHYKLCEKISASIMNMSLIFSQKYDLPISETLWSIICLDEKNNVLRSPDLLLPSLSSSLQMSPQVILTGKQAPKLQICSSTSTASETQFCLSHMTRDSLNISMINIIPNSLNLDNIIILFQ